MSGHDLQLAPDGSRFTVTAGAERAAVTLALPGRHNAANALAAYDPKDASTHAALAQLDSEESARVQMASLLECDPAFRISAHTKSLYFMQETDRAHYRDALRKAGLPE